MTSPTASGSLRGRLLAVLCVAVGSGILLAPLLVIHLAIQGSIADLRREAVAAAPRLDAIYDYRSTRGKKHA